jgi:hypothetical protein
MIPADFKDFFVASAGAGAALIGLLFVAISIAPERTVMAGASVERQALAANAFTALINAFFVSLVALIPGVDLGWAALVLSVIGVANSFVLGWYLLRHLPGWLSAVRRGFLVLASFLLYGYEFYNGVQLIRSPTTSGLFTALATLLVGIYGLALVRAWQLIGARRFLPTDWFSPIRTIEKPSVTADSKKGNE